MTAYAYFIQGTARADQKTRAVMRSFSENKTKQNKEELDKEQEVGTDSGQTGVPHLQPFCHDAFPNFLAAAHPLPVGQRQQQQQQQRKMRHG